mmetsp:Transcript_19028/g.37689  ORF Transcript_19028/g.37689 Transcript_19028/m.37689 type:complete len:136 (-) Transcript_19028:421-828(-)
MILAGSVLSLSVAILVKFHMRLNWREGAFEEFKDVPLFCPTRRMLHSLVGLERSVGGASLQQERVDGFSARILDHFVGVTVAHQPRALQGRSGGESCGEVLLRQGPAAEHDAAAEGLRVTCRGRQRERGPLAEPP